MTRQNSRPTKKKHHKQRQTKPTQQSPKVTLNATILTQFTASNALKAEILNKQKGSKTEKQKFQPYMGTVFSSGLCDIGNGKDKQTYIVRITNVAAAESILKVSPGTQIVLSKASFVDSYSGKNQKDISSSSYVVNTELTTPTSNYSTNGNFSPTSSTASPDGWFIYPINGGVKQKNGVTVQRPMLCFYPAK